jgi:hypothetical protein
MHVTRMCFVCWSQWTATISLSNMTRVLTVNVYKGARIPILSTGSSAHLKFYFLFTFILLCWFFRLKQRSPFGLTALLVKMASRTTVADVYSENFFKMYKFHASVKNLLISVVRNIYSRHCVLNLERNNFLGIFSTASSRFKSGITGLLDRTKCLTLPSRTIFFKTLCKTLQKFLSLLLYQKRQ